MAMNDYKDDAIVYFIENGRTIREAIVAETGPFYSLRFRGNSGEMAGIRLRAGRIYKTKEEAETAVKQLQGRSNHGQHDIQNHKERSAYSFGRFD